MGMMITTNQTAFALLLLTGVHAADFKFTAQLLLDDGKWSEKYLSVDIKGTKLNYNDPRKFWSSASLPGWMGDGKQYPTRMATVPSKKGEEMRFLFKDKGARDDFYLKYKAKFGRRRRRIAGDSPHLRRLLKQLRNRELNHRDHP